MYKMQSTMVHLSKLKPYDWNPQIHDAVNLKKIRASLDRFGCVTPLIVSETGGIIGGTGRWCVLKEMAKEGCLSKDFLVPVMIISGLSMSEIRTLNLALNNIKSVTDVDGLATILNDLRIDLDTNDALIELIRIAGYSVDEIDELLTYSAEICGTLDDSDLQNAVLSAGDNGVEGKAVYVPGALETELKKEVIPLSDRMDLDRVRLEVLLRLQNILDCPEGSAELTLFRAVASLPHPKLVRFLALGRESLRENGVPIEDEDDLLV